MKLVLSPKDSDVKLDLNDVTYWYHDNGVFHIFFNDNTVRIIPDCHVWYIEQEV